MKKLETEWKIYKLYRFQLKVKSNALDSLIKMKFSNMKMRIKSCFVFCLMFGILITTGCSVKKKVEKPNILFIAIDDLRPELGCYGATQVISPNIDKLASEGVLFKQAYANIPICMPSRVSILTGIHPLCKTFDDNVRRADISFPNLETLPEYLKKNGYYTISNGKIFHEKEDSDVKSWSEPSWRPKASTLEFLDETSKDFQRYSSYEYFDKVTQSYKKVEGNRGPFVEYPDVADDAYADGMILKKSIEDLEKLSKKDSPFFLAVGFNKPHLPFYAPKKYWDLYNDNKIDIADNRYFPKNAPELLEPSRELQNLYHLKTIPYNSEAFHRTAIHGYYACISYIDHLVGNLLTKLKELNLEKETIIVLWGDHGFHLGEHNMWGKHNTLKNALQTPLIIKVPNKQKTKVYEEVSLVDMYPTICTLVGLEVPAHAQGKNLFSIGTEEDELTNAVFFKWNGEEAVKTKQYLYSEWTDNNGNIIGRMLYDHYSDPDENNNIAHLDQYKSVVNELSDLLKKKKNSLY